MAELQPWDPARDCSVASKPFWQLHTISASGRSRRIFLSNAFLIELCGDPRSFEILRSFVVKEFVVQRAHHHDDLLQLHATGFHNPEPSLPSSLPFTARKEHLWPPHCVSMNFSILSLHLDFQLSGGKPCQERDLGIGPNAGSQTPSPGDRYLTIGFHF